MPSLLWNDTTRRASREKVEAPKGRSCVFSSWANATFSEGEPTYDDILSLAVKAWRTVSEEVTKATLKKAFPQNLRNSKFALLWAIWDQTENGCRLIQRLAR